RDEVVRFLVGSRDTKGEGSFRLRHHVSSVRIRIADEDHATAQSYFLAVESGLGPDHWGVYRDELVRENGAWRFARRTVTIEGATPNGWIGSGKGPVTL